MSNQTILTFILVVLAIGVGFMMGRMTAPMGSFALPSDSGTPSTVESTGATEGGGADATTENESSATVSTDSLTAGQQKLLGALGINVDEVTITPEMVACAEAKVGAARVEEISNGATPSLLEGASLVACYK